MKKVLISILVILLIVLTYFLVLKNIKIFNWKNNNVNDIKNLNQKLNEQIDIATQLNNQQYEEAKSNLETSIEELKLAKEKYESKVNYVSEDVQLGVVEIKEYKIERLWIALENYAKDLNVELKLDVLDSSSGNYDLNVTLVGEYIPITDFIYAIEKDDTLGFKILNFKLVPNTTITTTTTTQDDEEKQGEEKQEEQNNTQPTVSANVSAKTLRATFKIENVGIEFN